MWGFRFMGQKMSLAPYKMESPHHNRNTDMHVCVCVLGGGSFMFCLSFLMVTDWPYNNKTWKTSIVRTYVVENSFIKEITCILFRIIFLEYCPTKANELWNWLQRAWTDLIWISESILSMCHDLSHNSWVAHVKLLHFAFAGQNSSPRN